MTNTAFHHFTQKCSMTQRWVRFLSLLLILTGSSTAGAVEPDWTTYNQLLQKYISLAPLNGERVNMVRYSRLRRNTIFHHEVEKIENYPLDQLGSREEEIAFYINAFNMFALRMVVDHWPVKSIRDVGQFLHPVWDMPAGSLGGKTYSLDALMNTVLRRYDDPRVHFGVSCAAMGCASFRAEAYTAETLESQLDEQVAQFLSIRNGYRYDDKHGKVRLSKHFRWYRDDFKVFGGVEAFIGRYKSLPAGLKYEPNISCDWDINGR